MDIQEELKKVKALPNKLQELEQSPVCKNLSQIDKMEGATPDLKNDEIFFEQDNSHLGRPSLPEEEKAKSITIRLHQHHLEKLEFVPGVGQAEKVRYLIDTVSELKHREKKQFKMVNDQIDRCYRLAIKIHKPSELEDDLTKKNKLISVFNDEFKALEAMVNLFCFSYGDLKRGLHPSKATDIDIVFMVKDILK